ncbi:MAG: alpha/beta hydrolase [Rhodospirillaceae bacterium]|nr:alpha/beta hydrolase [Rhodospirillaceae bacterium]
MSAPAAIRRSYVDARFGQLHLRSARPTPGTVAHHTPLVCFHQSPQSGRIFTEVLKDLGRDRFVYAPDTPGFGESDPPPSPPDIADYAAAMGDLLDQLGHVPVDLLGYHTGALTATELALTRPHQVRRLVLIGMPLVDQAFIDAFNKTPWPLPFTEDASFVTGEWNRSMHWAGPGMTLPMIMRGFVDKLKAGDKAFWGGRAAMRYGFEKKLPQVTQPILAIGPKDDLWEISPRCEGLMKNGRFERWPDHGFGIFDVAATRINAKIRSHLDA